MPSEYLLAFAIQEKPIYTLAGCLRLADVGDLAMEHGLLADEDQSLKELKEFAEQESLLPALLNVSKGISLSLCAGRTTLADFPGRSLAHLGSRNGG